MTDQMNAILRSDQIHRSVSLKNQGCQLGPMFGPKPELGQFGKYGQNYKFSLKKTQNFTRISIIGSSEIYTFPSFKSSQIIFRFKTHIVRYFQTWQFGPDLTIWTRPDNLELQIGQSCSNSSVARSINCKTALPWHRRIWLKYSLAAPRSIWAKFASH